MMVERLGFDSEPDAPGILVAADPLKLGGAHEAIAARIIRAVMRGRHRQAGVEEVASVILADPGLLLEPAERVMGMALPPGTPLGEPEWMTPLSADHNPAAKRARQFGSE